MFSEHLSDYRPIKRFKRNIEDDNTTTNGTTDSVNYGFNYGFNYGTTDSVSYNYVTTNGTTNGTTNVTTNGTTTNGTTNSSNYDSKYDNIDENDDIYADMYGIRILQPRKKIVNIEDRCVSKGICEVCKHEEICLSFTGCNHITTSYCHVCMKNYISYLIYSGKTHIYCPTTNCVHILTMDEVNRYIN